MNVVPHRGLYPPIDPYRSGRLPVGDGHDLYWEECGRQDRPVVAVLHGGPGGGCSPTMRRFFDPEKWRVILYDQRGCGRSRPVSSLEHNTTHDLVADLEQLREHLGIERWALFGGSWGSTLALAYAQAHAERVTGLILRGIFLMTPQELEWFYGGGAGALLPEAWAAFLEHLEPEERGEPVASYYRRLTSSDMRTRRTAAEAWTAWESAAIDPVHGPRPRRRGMGAEAIDALARIECHYFVNRGFLDDPNALLSGVEALRGTPCWIVQGQLDFVTPPRSAWLLSHAWPEASFALAPGAGHAASDPLLVNHLVRATDDLAVVLSEAA